MSKMQSLKYSDERDRAFGVAGMAVAVCLNGNVGYCVSVSLEAPHGAEVAFSTDYFYRAVGGPRVSARKLWEAAVEDYTSAQSMVLANVLCRAMVENRALPSPALVAEARKELIGDSAEQCYLSEDEFSGLFDQELSRLRRVFSYPQVADMAREFADSLISRRTLGRDDLLQIFSPLLR